MSENQNFKQEKKISELENLANGIDYTAVIARMAGVALTENQKRECEKFDRLYDQTHPMPGSVE